MGVEKLLAGARDVNERAERAQRRAKRNVARSAGNADKIAISCTAMHRFPHDYWEKRLA
jgi:hypothetical protein